MKVTKILFTLMLFTSTVYLHSQSQSNIDILIKYRWNVESLYPKDFECYVTYTTSIEENTISVPDGKSITGKTKYKTEKASHQYYLSDKPEFNFDTKKVGLSKNGKYLITYNPVKKQTYCYEILELNETKLAQQPIYKDSDRKGQIVTYNASKK